MRNRVNGLGRGVLAAVLGLAVVAAGSRLTAAEPDEAATRDYAVAAGFQRKQLFEQAAGRWQRFIGEYPQDDRLAHAHYHLAVCQFQQQQYPQAAETFRTVLAKFPKFEQRDGAQYNLGLVQYNAALASQKPDDFQRAADELGKVPAQFGQSAFVAEALYYQAECLYQAGQREEAVAVYGRLIDGHDKSPLLPDALYALGTAQQELGQQADAGKTYQTFLQKFPKEAEAGEITLRLGMTLLAQQKPKEAEPHFRQAGELKDFPLADYALLQLGQALFDQDRPAEAAAAYESLPKRFPKSEHAGAALLAGGKSRYRAAQWDAARQDFAAVVHDKRPEAAEAAYWLGRTLLEQDNPAESVRQLERAIAAYPQSEHLPSLQFARLDALSRIDDRRKETVPLFAKFAAEHPQHALAPEALYRATLTALQTADYTNGRKHAEAFLTNADWAKHERLPDVLFLGGEHALLAAETDLPKAEPLYRRLIAEFPDHVQMPLAHVRVGFCLAAAKRPADAVSFLTQSLGKLKEPALQAEARLLIGRSQADLKKPQEAVAALREAYKAHPKWERADEVLLALALNLRAAGDDNAAAGELKRLNQEFPKSGLRDRALYQLADIALRQQKPDEAIGHFRELVSAFPQSESAPPAQYGIAAACFEKRDYRVAVTEASKLLSTWPQAEIVPKGKYLRGLAHQRLKNYDTAAKDLSAFLAAKPDENDAADARFALALCQIGQKQLPQAVETFKALLQTTPDYGRADEAWYQLALAHLDTNKEKEAAEAFRQLVTRHADSPLAPRGWFRLGEHHEKQEQPAEAAKAYAEGLKKAPPDELREALYHKLGTVQLAQQQYADAAKTFETQIKEHPQGKLVHDARFRAGEAYYRQQKFRDALPHYAAALAAPDATFHPRALYRSGDCAAALKEWPASEQHYRQLIERFPKFAQVNEARYGLGYALQQQNRLDDAKAVFEQVTKATNTETAAKSRFMMGECAFAQKKYDEALEHFLETAFGYGHPEWQAHAHYEAARCFQQLGKPQQARDSLETVVQKFPDHRLAKDAQTMLKNLK